MEGRSQQRLRQGEDWTSLQDDALLTPGAPWAKWSDTQANPRPATGQSCPRPSPEQAL